MRGRALGVLAMAMGLAGLAGTGLAAQSPSFHPNVPVLDEEGRNVLESGRAASGTQSCGACHDVAYIQEHSTHRGVDGAPGCLQCHTEPWTEGAGLDHVTIMDPPDAACVACHAETMAERTGARFAPERISASDRNVHGKDALDRPFDVHAERLVGCTDCHHSVNNPAQAGAEGRPAHLARDPRRTELGDYLRRPSHRLARSGAASDGAECESCHDVRNGESAHAWLPYAQQHMDAVACESCHVPEVYGPVLQAVDWTLPGPDGEPRREYRGADGAEAAPSTLHAQVPVLLPADGGGRLAPYNLVTRWRWVQGEEGEEVAPELLLELLYPDGEPAPWLAAARDRNQEPLREVARRLERVGVESPRVEGTVDAEPVHHGVVRGRWARQSCDGCHSRDAEAMAPALLTARVPTGATDGSLRLGALAERGSVAPSEEGLAFVPRAGSTGPYLLGRGRFAWINRLGTLALLGVLMGVVVHGGLRVRAGRRAPRKEHRPGRQVYMYGAYERLWHWLQAFAILGLLLTGIAIHLPDTFGWPGFAVVVRTHNILGFLLLANAFLAAFYHLASGELRQYLPRPRGFFSEAIRQATYYVRGIFRDEPHPFEKTPERKLNPLQKVTYLAILNVLLPMQVLTGLLIWLGQELPGLGGQTLAFLASVHTLAAWLFAAFLLMHIYLTTTGHTPTSNLKAMVDGWEEVESESVDGVRDGAGHDGNGNGRSNGNGNGRSRGRSSEREASLSGHADGEPAEDGSESLEDVPVLG